MSEKKEVTIAAAKRTVTGKGHMRKLRAAGKVPAVLNHKGQSTMLELDPKLLSRAWKDNGRQFNTTLDGQTKRVAITELQLDPVKRSALHVDLAYVE